MAKPLTHRERLIKRYIQTEKDRNDASEALYKYLNDTYMPEIDAAKTLEDCIAIKEKLRDIPNGADKILIFRSIILREDEIKKISPEFSIL